MLMHIVSADRRDCTVLNLSHQRLLLYGTAVPENFSISFHYIGKHWLEFSRCEDKVVFLPVTRNQSAL